MLFRSCGLFVKKFLDLCQLGTFLLVGRILIAYNSSFGFEFLRYLIAAIKPPGDSQRCKVLIARYGFSAGIILNLGS
mgnify:CR=1 FL=1